MSYSTWKEVRIGDEIVLQYGKSLTKTVRNELGTVPVYGSNGKVGVHNFAYVNEPGVIIGRKGTVGSVHYSSVPFYPIDTTYYLNPKNNDLKFIYYFLQTLGMENMNTHSAVPGLNRDNVYNLRRKIPPYIEQKAIAETLSCLDEKIELNNRINKNLEEMAQTIFKSWFVDFEPFQDGGFEDTKLGLIPKNWRVGKLGDVLTLNYGKSLTANKRINGKVRVYSSAGITGSHTQALVNESSIIVGRKGTIGTVYFSSKPSYCIDTAYFASQTDCKFPLLIMFQLLKYLNLTEYNEDSAVPGLNRNTVYQINIAIPPISVLEQCNQIISSIFNEIDSNHDQIQLLTNLRDSLLPKLMNGEIRIPVQED